MAALCEPRLLRERTTVSATLAILDRLTASVRDAGAGRADDLRILRQALGYGWSVVVAVLNVPTWFGICAPSAMMS